MTVCGRRLALTESARSETGDPTARAGPPRRGYPLKMLSGSLRLTIPSHPVP
jgi:hypothetical protein